MRRFAIRSRVLPLPWWGIPLLALALSGCQHGLMSNYAKARRYMLAGDFAAAVEVVEQGKGSDYADRDRVVYYMNKGLLERYAEAFEESIESLSKAEARSEELYTISLSKEAASLLTSDVVTDYAGEDFEQVLLNVYNAINYLSLDNLEDALVEIRRVNEKLALFNTRYETHKNRYDQDAFAHWFSGLLFEMEGYGSFDDALISYKKSYEAYERSYRPLFGTPLPPFLREDLLRAAALAGFRDEEARFSEMFGIPPPDLDALSKTGEIILIHENGESPQKSDFYITCYVAKGLPVPLCSADWSEGGFTRKRIVPPIGGRVFQVAFPRYDRVPYQIRASALSVEGRRVPTFLMEDIAAIAERTLDDRMGRIFTKTITRAATKFAAGYALEKGVEHAVGKKRGEVAGAAVKLLAGILNQATEEADKRSWLTLPAEIRVARLRLPPGTYDATIEFFDAHGNLVSVRILDGVRVEAGRRTILTYRTLQ